MADNWSPLNATERPVYDPARLLVAAKNAEEAGDDQAAKMLRHEAKVQQFRVDAMAALEDGPGSDAFKKIAPLSGMGGPERFAQGAGLAARNIGRGAGELLGVDMQPRSEQRNRMDAALMESPAGVAGNVAGNLAVAAPVAFIPGANTVAGAALTGAALGALQPTGETGLNSARLENAAVGTIGGAAGGAVARGLSRIANPRNAAAVRKLTDEGVSVTPGQALGGMANRVEEKLTSIPFIGDDIIKAREGARTQFNVATLNRVLSPIGRKVAQSGREGVDEAHKVISQYYDDVLKDVGGVKLDRMFMAQVDEILNMADEMPPDRKTQLMNTLRSKLQNNATPAGRMSGESFKRAESEIRRMATDYLKSPDADQRKLGEALGQVGRNLRDVLKRQNPQMAGALGNADKAWAMLKRAERAAGYVGAQGGEFTPSQLLSAVKASDKSLGKSAFSRGNSYMQDWAENAKNVMGDKVGNSYTADRLMNALMFGGAYGAASNPALIAPALAAKGASMAMYSEPGRRVMTSLLMNRPELLQQLGYGTGKLTGPAGAAGALYSLEQ